MNKETFVFTLVLSKVCIAIAISVSFFFTPLSSFACTVVGAECTTSGVGDPGVCSDIGGGLLRCVATPDPAPDPTPTLPDADPTTPPGGEPAGEGGGGEPTGGGGGGEPAGGGGGQSIRFENTSRFTSIPAFLGGIVSGILLLLATISVVLLVLFGIRYMTASSASEAAQAATGIRNVIVGLILVVGAYLIVQYVISAVLA